jgi:DNA-binding NarL/FixJ family response regulator
LICGRNAGAPDLQGGRVLITTVLVADDNLAILDHLGTMLEKEKDYEVVATISDGTVVVHECLRLRPDVVLLDISVGSLSGIDIARQLRDSGCIAKIVFVTVHEDVDYMNAAIGAGGSAYVVKSRLSLDLLTAIRAALSNKLFVSDGLQHKPS